MTPFDAAAILVVCATVLGYVNYRFVRLPHMIGLTVMGAVASIVVIGFDMLWPRGDADGPILQLLAEVDFSRTLMDGMLSFLLFAGALYVDLGDLLPRKWTVAILATIGVLTSTVLVAAGFYFLTPLLGFPLPFVWCLVFGALISPTDPVAVLGILRSANVPPSLEATFAGESLFNDGIGIVVFSIVLTAAVGTGSEGFSGGHALKLFLKEAGGGIALGAALGAIGHFTMKTIDEHNLEVLISLSIVMGGYALAQYLHVSGPVSMAVAGLMIGNYATAFAMSDKTREHLTRFWSLLEEILNSVLFLLIGLEVVAIAKDVDHLVIGVIAILIVLAARLVSVGVPYSFLRRRAQLPHRTLPILVWGGLRGGISIALALSLPSGEERLTILTATYVVVIFSVVVQGTTVGKVARRLVSGDDGPHGSSQSAA